MRLVHWHQPRSKRSFEYRLTVAAVLDPWPRIDASDDEQERAMLDVASAAVDRAALAQRLGKHLKKTP